MFQEQSLFYDPNTGTYFYFDAEKQQYQFHSQINIVQSQPPSEVTSCPRVDKTVDKRRNRHRDDVSIKTLFTLICFIVVEPALDDED